MHCPILDNRFSELKKTWRLIFKTFGEKFQNMIAAIKKKCFSMHRTLVTCTATIEILCLPKADDSSATGRWILSRKWRSSPFGSNCRNGFVVRTAHLQRDMKWVNGVFTILFWWLIEILFTATLHLLVDYWNSWSHTSRWWTVHFLSNFFSQVSNL